MTRHISYCFKGAPSTKNLIEIPISNPVNGGRDDPTE